MNLKISVKKFKLIIDSSIVKGINSICKSSQDEETLVCNSTVCNFKCLWNRQNVQIIHGLKSPSFCLSYLYMCKNLKDILVRARLTSGREKRHNNRGSSCCKKSRCQVCKVMPNIDTFKSCTTGKEYKINYSFNCDSSNVVYLIECNVCGVQYVGSTCTAFRLRFNNYKACSRKFKYLGSFIYLL